MNNNSNNCGGCGTTCSECGRPWAICKQDGGCGCNKCKDIKFCEYGRMANGCIREKQPGCPMQAVIPSVTVESIEGIKNLADCLVHVSDINTTFYIDDKHRPIITWAGPIDIPGYDMDGNPNNYRDQIVTDVANQEAVIYDKSGRGYVFGLVENIDLQEQVNNKLDAMAEDGTLQEIIGAYLNATATWGFDTVADMVSSTNLIDGSFAQTLGFYNLNDGGGALYKIRKVTNDDVVDGAFIIEIGNSADELIAELVYFGEVNIKQLGAKGDGTTNDTSKFTLATSKGLDIFAPAGVYRVSQIILGYSETLRGESWTDTEIKAIDNDNVTSVITTVDAAMRVNILNLAVNGNRTNNSNTFDGIHLYKTTTGNDTHSFINNVRVFECTGNGIKMERQLESRISHCVCNNNALNGIIYINTSDAVIEDTTCSSNSQNGIRVTNGANRIVNCKCFYNGFNNTLGYTDTRYSGFYISGSNNTISGCHAQENGAHGIELGESNEITVSGCCVDNNGLYFDENRQPIPLPDGVDPLYDGVHANHVRRSYIEVCGKNFHLTNGSTQRTTLNFANGSECGLNTFVVSSGNQLVKDFEMNDAVRCYGTVNGIVVESIVSVGWRFLDNSNTVGAITSDKEFPLTVREENGYIHVRGGVTFENEITTAMNELSIIKITDATKYNKESIFLTVQAYPTSLYSDPKGFINARMATDGSIKVRNRGSLTGIRKLLFDFTYIPVEQQNS